MDPELQLDQLWDLASQASTAGRLALVVEILPVYLEHRPGHGYAWFILGDSLREVGRWSEALDALSVAKSLASDEQFWRVCAALGLLYHDWGRHGDAETWFARAAQSEVGRECGWLWIMRGANLSHLARLDEAEACYRRATSLEGDRDEAYLNLGYVLRARRKYSEAAEAFQLALRITPDYTAAREALESLADVSEGIRLADSLGTDTGGVSRATHPR